MRWLGCLRRHDVGRDVRSRKGQGKGSLESSPRADAGAPEATAPRPISSAIMIRLAITPAAFDAIAATLPLGSVGYENAVNEKGERLIWLAPNVVDRLRAMRGPRESYSDVILRVAALVG